MNSDEKRAVKFQLMLSEAELEAIDDWSFKNRVRTRAQAIRRLVQRGFILERFVDTSLEAGELITNHLTSKSLSTNEAMEYLVSLSDDFRTLRQLRASLEKIRSQTADIEALVAGMEEWVEKYKSPKPPKGEE